MPNIAHFTRATPTWDTPNVHIDGASIEDIKRWTNWELLIMVYTFHPPNQRWKRGEKTCAQYTEEYGKLVLRYLQNTSLLGVNLVWLRHSLGGVGADV